MIRINSRREEISNEAAETWVTALNSRGQIVWRPFQLNPDMPVEGMNRKTYRTKKFGSWERSLAMGAEGAAIGQSLGIEFTIGRILNHETFRQNKARSERNA